MHTLDEGSAVQLFLDRVGTLSDSPVIRTLVRKLDGLPLAIELAAARIHQLTPECLLARIGERLDLLVRPSRDITSRHTSLRSAFDWSWDLLGDDERRALGWLSVLVSPFDAATANALLGEQGERLVRELAACSLVHPEGSGRWRLFEAIREYAGEKLVLSGKRDEALARRAELFLSLAERRVATLDGAEAGPSYRGLRGLRDEIVAVHRTAADGDTAARAALVIAALEDSTGHTTLLVEMLEAAIHRAPSDPWLWQLWWRLGTISNRTGDSSLARQQLGQALSIARRQTVRAEAIVRLELMHTDLMVGDSASMLCEVMEARTLFLSIGEVGWAARALGRLAYSQLHLGSPDGMKRMAEAVAELRASGQLRHLARWLTQMGRALGDRGAFAQARACLAEALTLARSSNDLWAEVLALYFLAVVDLEAGALRKADERLLDLESRSREFGQSSDWQLGMGRVGIRLLRGDLAGAEALLLSLPVARSPLGARVVQANLAVLGLFRGETSVARAELRASAVSWDRHHSFWLFANLYQAIAAALEGDFTDADRLLVDVRRCIDRELFGSVRLLELCEAIVDLVRTRAIDPEGAAARAQATLAAGRLVLSDEQRPIELPHDVNLARLLLLQLLGSSSG